MIKQSNIKNLFIDARFSLLLLAPMPVWIYLYCVNGISYRDTLMVFLTIGVLYPIAEEVLFRGLIQPFLSQRLSAKTSIISASNMITSALFSAAHLINHPPIWALATFIPSLIFGYTQERYKSLNAPIILHCSYNAGYFLVAGQL